LTVEGWEYDALARGASPRYVAPEGGEPDALSGAGARAAEAFAAYAAGVHAEAAGDFAEAEAFYDRACAAAAELPEIGDEEPLHRAVAVRLAARKFGEVAEKMEAHYRAHPGRPAVAAWLVQFYFSADEKGRAEEIAAAGVRDFPGVADFWSIKAGLESAAGDNAAAVATLRKGIGKATGGDMVSKTDLRLQLAELLCPAGRVPPEGESRKLARENFRALREENAPPETPSEGVISWEAAQELYAKLLVADGALAEAVAVADGIEARDERNLGEKTRLALLLSSAGADAAGLLAVAHDRKADPAARAAAAAYAGVLLSKAGKNEEALAAFREALDARAHDIACWIHAAVAARRAEGREAAERIFEAGEAANPDSAALREGRGRLAADAGDHAAACRAFARAAEIAAAKGEIPGVPEDGGEDGGGEKRTGELTREFPFRYACELTRAGEGKKAGEWLRRAGEAGNRYLALFAEEGGELETEARQALFRAAAEACGTAAETHPLDEDELRFAQGFFYGALGKPRKSLQALAAAEEAAGALPTGMSGVLKRDIFHYMRALAYIQLKQFRNAEEPLQRCLDINPNHADALNTLAYTWACRGQDLERAERYVRRALAQEPDNPAFRDTLAWVLHMQGRDAEAIKEIRKAKKAMPDDPDIRAHWNAIRAALKAADRPAEE
jgi:tetratricopeptide (TPR) repeat protein